MITSGQTVSEIVAQLCLENSIQTLLIFGGVDRKKFRRVCMEFSKHNWATIYDRVNLQAVFFSSYLVHKRGIMDSWSQAFLEETVETGDKNRNMTDNITLFRAP